MFLILTVCEYVSPAGTSTKLTASGVISTDAGGMREASALGLLPPNAQTRTGRSVEARKIPITARPIPAKLLKGTHLRRLPTINVPPLNCLPPHRMGVVWRNMLFRDYWSSVQNRDRLRVHTVLPLRTCTVLPLVQVQD